VVFQCVLLGSTAIQTGSGFQISIDARRASWSRGRVSGRTAKGLGSFRRIRAALDEPADGVAGFNRPTLVVSRNAEAPLHPPPLRRKSRLPAEGV